MADARSIEDVLREEYFAIAPEVRRALLETETRVRSALLSISLRLQRYERVVVTSRMKDCDSAIDALRRRQPLGLFDPAHEAAYSLRNLRDLAAVRVMAFPHERLTDCRSAVVPLLDGWTADPVPHVIELDSPLAYKYYGKWRSTDAVTAEVQLVPLLVGLFWEVEHAAMYKPSPNLHGIVLSEAVLQRRNEVLAALRAFESEFEAAVRDSEQGD